MDHTRRDLIVEGVRDKAFLEWLLGVRMNKEAQIIIADFIDVPDVTAGGNRARLLAFMTEIGSLADVQIFGFIDADHHRFLNPSPPLPSKVWITDHRDLESYVISVENLDTALRAGCGLLTPSGSSVLASVIKVCRYLAGVRLVSERRELRLRVSASKWIKHVSCEKGGAITLDREKMLEGLLQTSDHSLKMAVELQTEISATESELAGFVDRDVVHGKDFTAVLTKHLKTHGVNIDSASRLLFSTFDRSSLCRYPSLSAVTEYLSVA